MNPDGERDYRGHPDPKGGNDVPLKWFLIMLAFWVVATCILLAIIWN